MTDIARILYVTCQVCQEGSGWWQKGTLFSDYSGRKAVGYSIPGAHLAAQLRASARDTESSS